MLHYQITREAEKAMDKMPDRHFCQIYDAIEGLRALPEPQDSRELSGTVLPRPRRKDVGEYRIIYWYDEKNLHVDLVGKRNDDEVYRKAKRMGIL